MATIDPYAPGNAPRQTSDEMRKFLDSELYRISIALNDLLEKSAELETRIKTLETP